jgi:hypothetical protein
MAISLQADSTLPQGYILVDGQRAATISTAGLSATLADGLVTTSALVNDAVTTEKIASSSVTAAKMGYSGAVVASRYYEQTTEIALSNQAAFTIWSGTDIKTFGTTTNILVFFNGWGRSNAGGHSGMYFEYDGVREYQFIDYTYSSWGANNIECQGVMRFTGRGSGSRAFNFGWATTDGAASTPALFWNPNSQRSDNRARKSSSNIIILEVIA